MTADTVCEICGDDGMDWEIRGSGRAWHKRCLQERAAMPSNEREYRGVINTLTLGYAIATATVKRPDLFGNVEDTYATEGELNGWKPTQGRIL